MRDNYYCTGFVIAFLLIVLLLIAIVYLKRIAFSLCSKAGNNSMWKKYIASKKKKRNKVLNFCKLLIDAFIYIFAYPISCIVPNKKGLILFMGRQKSGFLDNNKYLLIYLKQEGILDQYDVWFMGHKDPVVSVLSEHGFKTENYFSLKTYWLILRADVIITDNAHWTTHNRYTFASKAHLIQMWHGIGFKKIRLSDEDFVKKSKGIKGLLKYKIQGQLAVYDTFISTSEFFSQNVFSPSFKPKSIVELGYCRNDVLFDDYEFDDSLVKINTDEAVLEQVKRYKDMGKKVILYAPTFRNAISYHVSPEQVDFSLLNEFAQENNYIIVFKLHPLPKNLVSFLGLDNIIEYNSKSDVYPLFKYTDLLITDYSSIYLDYVLLDKPCAFFMYDYNFYITACREIREDYSNFLPGPLCYTQPELQNTILDLLENKVDGYKERRKDIRDLSWKYQDGRTCERVWLYIETTYLKGGRTDE